MKSFSQQKDLSLRKPGFQENPIEGKEVRKSQGAQERPLFRSRKWSQNEGSRQLMEGKSQEGVRTENSEVVGYGGRG